MLRVMSVMTRFQNLFGYIFLKNCSEAAITPNVHPGVVINRDMESYELQERAICYELVSEHNAVAIMKAGNADGISG